MQEVPIYKILIALSSCIITVAGVMLLAIRSSLLDKSMKELRRARILLALSYFILAGVGFLSTSLNESQIKPCF